MKYINSILLKSACALSIVLMIHSCDNEFSEIGSDIVGLPDFEIQNKAYPIKTYNKRITPFQSNGLDKDLLGYYYDDVFGGSTVNFVGQMIPGDFSPTFGENTMLDSVVLTIPYPSSSTIVDGSTSFTLDSLSLYGSNPIKLSIFKNDFLLRDYDPNAGIGDPQNYYSNSTLTSGQSIEPSLEGQLLYYSPSYLPKAEPHVLTAINEETGESEVTTTLNPSLRVHLYNNPDFPSPTESFWNDLILSREDDEVLSSSENFYNHFRGLYFKTEPSSGTEGHMMQLDLFSAQANLSFYYTYDRTLTVDGVDETSSVQGTYELRFSGNRVNLFKNDFNASILQTINDTSTDSDDVDYLYLKGGEGSMAVIELFTEDEFGNTEADHLNEFREVLDGQTTPKRLINEAFLEFYVEETLSNPDIPNRVYIYDIDNNMPVADYFLDPTINTTSADSKYIHLVPLEIGTDSDGVEYKKYKVRLTEHLKNIIIRDSTNVKLGLVVSSNVGAINQKSLQSISEVEGIPTGAILSPKSVVLHGTNSPITAKNPKLNIYYTDPNN